jgi:CubicO group peptidase (beta-lactamase class C family)
VQPADSPDAAPAPQQAVAYLATCVDAGELPSAVLEVGGAAGAIARHGLGVPDDAVYDLASLTKVLLTGLVAARLVAAGRLSLDARVADWVPEWQGPDRIDVRVRDLLTHASGLPAHRPLYQRQSGKDEVIAACARIALEHPPRTRAVYSDLGFIVLGRALERAAGDTLDSLATGMFADDIDGVLQFAPVPEGRRVQPTGESPWRGRSLIGEVHDDNAAAMGGVAGHAGLFGTAASVGQVACLVLRGLRGEDTKLAPSWVIRAFTRRSPVPGSSRALAWDTALPSSSCGPLLSQKAIGHTGFTGTSLWIDPAHDRYVVLLTNRVAGHGTLEDMRRIRRRVHDLLAAGWLGRRG